MQHRDAPSVSRLLPHLLSSACLLLLAACGSSSRSPAEEQLKLQLKRADSCAGLLDRVQEGLVSVTVTKKMV